MKRNNMVCIINVKLKQKLNEKVIFFTVVGV